MKPSAGVFVPVSTLPEMMRTLSPSFCFFTLPLRIESTLAPATMRTYCGRSISEPATAMIFVMIDTAFVEQAADDGQVLMLTVHTTSPLFTGVHMVDLHADIADGVFARKGVEFGALERGHLPFGLGAHREVHLARSEPAHHVDTRLEVLLFGFQHEIVVRGQRRGVEGGDEDRFRRVAGVGDDAVRALHDHRPETRPEQQGDDLLARSRPEVGLLKLLVLLGGVGRSPSRRGPCASLRG